MNIASFIPRRPWRNPIAVLVLGVALTATAVVFELNRWRDATIAAYQAEVKRTTESFQGDFHRIFVVLSQINNLYSASGSVDESEFRVYASSLFDDMRDLNEAYQFITAAGWLPVSEWDHNPAVMMLSNHSVADFRELGLSNERLLKELRHADDTSPVRVAIKTHLATIPRVLHPRFGIVAAKMMTQPDDSTTVPSLVRGYSFAVVDLHRLIEARAENGRLGRVVSAQVSLADGEKLDAFRHPLLGLEGTSFEHQEAVKVRLTASTPLTLTYAIKRDALQAFESRPLAMLLGGIVASALIALYSLRMERQNALLRQANIDAESATRAKSQFLATMSHEIRTPLNGLIGIADILQRTPLTQKQRELLGALSRSADGLLSTINDVLDFSKIEAGKIDLALEPVNLFSLVNDVAALYQPIANLKGLEFIVDYPPSLAGTVLADSTRLRQVLTNLMGNALKFTAAGSVALSIKRSADDAEPNRSWVEFIVEDTGPGIPPEAMRHLFERFRQADQSTTRKFGGTGLGLAIVKQLVELMGGDVLVESSLGEGSCFRCRIPFTPVRDHADEVPGAVEGILFGALPSRARGTFVRALSDLTAPIDLCDTAQGLLTRYHAKLREGAAYQLIVVDDTLPGMAVKDIAHTLRAAGAPKSTLVALVSEADVAMLQQQGLFGCILRKPVIAAKLAAVVRGGLRNGFAEGARNELQAPVLPIPIEPDAQDPAALSGRTVLMVEDSPVNQMVCGEMLDELGVRYVIAANGLEALSHMRAANFDAVLMDCLMPEMDGYTAASELRRLMDAGAMPATPIIALTANAMSDDEQKCLAAGMHDYLAKPVRAKDLSLKLRRWIGVAARGAKPTAPVDTQARPAVAGPAPTGDGEPANQAGPVAAPKLVTLLAVAPESTGEASDATPKHAEVPPPADARPSEPAAVEPAKATALQPLPATAEASGARPSAAVPSLKLVATSLAPAAPHSPQSMVAKKITPAEQFVSVAALESAAAVPLFDAAAFENTRAAMKGRFGSLIAIYRADSLRLSKSLASALMAGSATRAILPAHTIKSSSRLLGGTRVVALAALLEAEAKRMQSSEVDVPALAKIATALSIALAHTIGEIDAQTGEAPLDHPPIERAGAEAC